MPIVRLSPGVYQDTSTGRRVNASTQAQAERQLGGGGNRQQRPAAGGGQQQNPLRNLPAGVRRNIRNEMAVQDVQAGRNVGLQGSQVNPFGRQDVTMDDQGRVTVEQGFSPEQQGIYNADVGLSQMGRDLAMGRFQDSGFGQAFNPQLAARTSTGDLNADRARMEEEVFGRLTRTTDRDYSRERENLSQELANRGIPVGSELYNRQMQGLDERYDTIRSNARADATRFGGEEMQRGFGMNEQLIANQFSQQQAMRNQNLGELQNLGGFGTGLMVPNFNPYQAPQYQLPSPTGIQQSNRQLAIQQQQANRPPVQIGGGGAPSNPSPFVA